MKFVIYAAFAALIAQPVVAAPAEPLRTILLEGSLRKLKVSPADVSHEVVCNFSAEIPVYASLKDRTTAREGAPHECKTTIAGRKTKLQISGLIFISNSGSRIAKRANMTLAILVQGREPIYVSGSAGVGEPSAKTWSLSIQSQLFRSSNGVQETVFGDLSFQDPEKSVH